MKRSHLYRRAGEKVAAGWCQGVAFDNDGNVCAIGALISAGGTHVGVIEAASDVFISALKVDTDLDGSLMNTLARWNDFPSRTREDVVLAFKYAEAAALERGE